MMNNIRIKVSAIAKDEAAYLPEWIFHHLHFGFDHLEILINRTNDNSVAILDKIRNNHINVSYRNYDWLDFCPDAVKRSIQYVAYADAYARAKTEGYTHIFFIDIDEFWTPYNFQDSIKQFLLCNDTGASYSFHWNCELGLTDKFSPLEKSLTYFPNDHIKTLICLDSPLQSIKIHAPILAREAKHLLADGSTFISRDSNGQFAASEFYKNPEIPAFVVHRMYRSEMEYISSLLRGNPNSNENIGSLFKDNRHGFKKTSGQQSRIDFPLGVHTQYLNDYKNFLSDCGIESDLAIAQSYVEQRAQQTIAAAFELVALDRKRAEQIFSGCTNSRIVGLLGSHYQPLRHSIDSVTLSDRGFEVRGWAISSQPNLPILFSTSDPNSRLTVEFIDRPDVVSLYPGRTQQSGFKALIQNTDYHSNLDDNTVIMLISSPAKIQTHHGSHVFYQTKTNKFEHIAVEKLANSIGMLPAFIADTDFGESLAVLSDGKIKICCMDEYNTIKLIEKEKLNSTDTPFIKRGVTNTTFSITVRNRFLSAVKEGATAIDRTEAKGWEIFCYDCKTSDKIEVLKPQTL